MEKKNYRVSIACYLPANFEVHVSASTKEEAYTAATELYESGDYEIEELTENGIRFKVDGVITEYLPDELESMEESTHIAYLDEITGYEVEV